MGNGWLSGVPVSFLTKPCFMEVNCMGLLKYERSNQYTNIQVSKGDGDHDVCEPFCSNHSHCTNIVLHGQLEPVHCTLWLELTAPLALKVASEEGPGTPLCS